VSLSRGGVVRIGRVRGRPKKSKGRDIRDVEKGKEIEKEGDKKKN
jgi:hypothetical protein